jgi:glycosyltransferase involved in cell wall biosynthesis
VSKKVAILLCTYQGQQYLTEQLDSYAAQTYTDWELWVSDDGSKDDTHRILESYKTAWPQHRLTVTYGPRKGFAANFLSIACNPSISADYYSFSDQDDVWDSVKLERAVQWLDTVAPDRPALYCARTQLVDCNDEDIGCSPLFKRPPGFNNALVQNIAGGNTMVFNNAARELLIKAGPAIDVVAHDWWVYQVVSGCGGKVHYDPRPSLRYRQHGGNLIGANGGLEAKLVRIRMLFQGQLKDWNDRNIVALNSLRSWMSPDALRTLERFEAARQGSILARTVGIYRMGIYRQSFLGNLGLLAAALFNKI